MKGFICKSSIRHLKKRLNIIFIILLQEFVSQEQVQIKTDLCSQHMH